MLLVSSRLTGKSPDRICGYALRLGGSSLMHVFTIEMKCNGIPRHIVTMGGLPLSKWLMVLDDTPRICFYSTRYGANLGKTVSVPDSMKEGTLEASTAIFPDGSAMAVLSPIGILVCPFPGYLVERQDHAGSLASMVGSNKVQREEENTEQQHTTSCVDFRRFAQANLKDALTSTKDQIPIACSGWPMIPGTISEDNIRLQQQIAFYNYYLLSLLYSSPCLSYIYNQGYSPRYTQSLQGEILSYFICPCLCLESNTNSFVLCSYHVIVKAKGQRKKLCLEQMTAALTEHTTAILKSMDIVHQIQYIYMCEPFFSCVIVVFH